MLEWQLRHGANEKAIRDTAAKTGMPLPDFVLNKPKLLPGLELFWIAFMELDSDRPINPMGGEEPALPWSAIHRYAEAFGYAEDRVFFVRFTAYLRKMDSAYRDFYNEKRKVAAAQAKRKR